jgi:hypoxanthine phosphoribosyltransferase
MLKFYITWDEIESYTKHISKKIHLANKEYDCIICAGRGAMIPSRMLSGLLGISEIHYVDYTTYVNTEKVKQLSKDKAQNIAKQLECLSGYKRVLIVDDCISTGGTVLEIKSMLSQYVDEVDIAVLYINDNAPHIPNTYYSERFNQDAVWLVFPWEVNDK